MKEQTETKILRMPDVMKKIGASRSTVYRLMAEENFPRSIKVSKRNIGWRLNDVENWLDHRAEHAA